MMVVWDKAVAVDMGRHGWCQTEERGASLGCGARCQRGRFTEPGPTSVLLWPLTSRPASPIFTPSVGRVTSLASWGWGAHSPLGMRARLACYRLASDTLGLSTCPWSC